MNDLAKINKTTLSSEDILRDEIQKTREELPFSLTIDILAELMDMSHRKLYEAASNGNIPGIKKIMGQWRVPRDTFLSWWYGEDQDG